MTKEQQRRLANELPEPFLQAVTSYQLCHKAMALKIAFMLRFKFCQRGQTEQNDRTAEE